MCCRLRDIFIDERRSLNKVEGPKDSQAAMAMGNSERAWTDFYDGHYQKRECQAGVAAMASWRQSMLSRTAQPSQKVSQPALHAASAPSLCVPPEDPSGLAAAPSANVVVID